MDAGKALELEDIPTRLLVIGGSYVGLELGLVYARLGSQVTLVEMTDRLLPNVDADLVQPLARRVQDLFAGVYLKTTVTALEQKKAKVRVAFVGQAALSNTTYDRVLVAIGRQPNTDHLGLEKAGVDIDAQGYVVVDKQRRTTNARLLAIGDVASGMLLAHKAMHEGKVAAEVIAGQRVAFDASAIPAVVYTDPQIAWCGLTEHAAAIQHRPVKVGRFPWKASGRAVSMGATESCTKIVLDPASHGVLGMGVVGQHAEALIAEGVLAVEMGALAEDVALTIHPHPTLSETVGEAAAVSCGGSSPLYGLGENFLLAFLCESHLAPLPFHQSFRSEFVKRCLQGIFPSLIVASYMGLQWPKMHGQRMGFIGPKEMQQISLHVLFGIHRMLL